MCKNTNTSSGYDIFRSKEQHIDPHHIACTRIESLYVSYIRCICAEEASLTSHLDPHSASFLSHTGESVCHVNINDIVYLGSATLTSRLDMGCIFK